MHSALLQSWAILRKLILEACGTCDAFQQPEFRVNSAQSSEFTFPVTRIEGAPTIDAEGGKFLPIIDVPGIVLLRKPVVVRHEGYVRVAQQSLWDSWPIFALSSVMAILAGIIMWILVSGIYVKSPP